MATIVAQEIVYTGLEAVYVAAAGAGDQVLSGGNVFLHVKNGSGVAITVTLATPGTTDGLAIADPDTVITAGEDRFIGPLTVDTFGDNADGNLVSITYSAVTTLTIAALYV